ncbi:MAG TPA: phosphatidylserine decarboxylase family protein [Bacteroidota bacterium]
MITRYGYDVFFTIATVCTVLVIVAAIFIEPKLPRYCVIILSATFFGLTVNFFRDPDRTTPSGESHIIAPADGKIVAVRQIDENEYLHSRATQISIFMSPLNVHVNRNPISGTVQHVRYVPGEYFAAYEDKASEKNEQMVVGLENAHGKVLFKQIAGFLARRIVCSLKVGERVTAGERFGMIKFGSRVDVFVEEGSEVRVRVGDISVAGETILADFRK